MQMKNKKRVIQIALIVIAAALIVVGALNGGYRDAWNKAIHICFECVGIG